MNILLQTIHGLDVGVYRFLGRFAGSWLFDHLASFEEGNDLFKGGLFLAMYANLWFRDDMRQRERRKAILAILAGALFALVAARTVADLSPYRVRPIYDMSLPHPAYSLRISPNLEDWSSFPSDTAAFFAALAFGLVHLLRRYSGLIWLYTAVWICLPRMFLGLHYLSDIVIGATIGILLVKASLKSEWLRRDYASPVLRWMEMKPQHFYTAAFLVAFEMGVLFDDVRVAARQIVHAVRALPHQEAHVLQVGLGSIGIALVGASITLLVINWPYRRVIIRYRFGSWETSPGHGQQKPGSIVSAQS